jgi:hypothetical protein
MPERPVPYAEEPFISQVRKAQLRLHFLQLRAHLLKYQDFPEIFAPVSALSDAAARFDCALHHG